MRIGEVARLAGTTTKATRFYESVGLLPPPGPAENGYRDYKSADAERLRLLVGLRSLDVSLERAGELAVLCAAGHCDRVSVELRDLVAQQRAEVGRQVAVLTHLDERLATLERARTWPPTTHRSRSSSTEGGSRWRPVIARVGIAAAATHAAAVVRVRVTPDCSGKRDHQEGPCGPAPASGTPLVR